MSEIKICTTELGEGKPVLSIHVDSQFICLDENKGAWMKFRFAHMPTTVWVLMVIFAIMAVGSVVARMWLSPGFHDKASLLAAFPGTVKAMYSTNEWPRTVIVVALLATIVTMFWIGCKCAVRMAKLAYEEWNQRFAMRKFVFEKTIEYAERSAKTDKRDGNDGKWSIDITVNKNAEKGKKQQSARPSQETKPDNDNSPSKPSEGPSPNISQSNQGTPESPLNSTNVVLDQRTGTNWMWNSGASDLEYAELTPSASKC